VKSENKTFAYSEEERALKAKLEGSHGAQCNLIKAAGLEAWFSDPGVEEIDAYLAEQMDEKTKGSAGLDLMRNHFVHPGKAGADGAAAFFKQKPGAQIAFMNGYFSVVGITAEHTVGK
jgi:hypothetical protein